MNAAQHDLIVSLHRRYSATMEQYAFRITGDRHIAQDLVQEVFLTATLKVDTLMNHENPGGWLYTTLNNIAKREMNRAYRKAELPLEDDVASQKDDMMIRLEYGLPKELSDTEREILIMRFEKQMDYADIAELKGITQAACRQQLSRAVRHCRKILDNSEPLSQNPLLPGYKG